MICSVIGHDTVSNPKILHNYVHDFPSLIVSVRMFIFLFQSPLELPRRNTETGDTNF